VGRPREHTNATAAALLSGAEELVETGGVEALSVRAVAAHVGTTTRAVYSLYGSKSGLVAALGAHAFGLLGEGVNALPETNDPLGDLVQAGLVFRSFACSHPSLFQVAVQKTAIPPEVAAQFGTAAQAAFAHLEHRVQRLDDKGLLGGRSTHDAACQFHALCEGLAAVELRGIFSDPPNAERQWREALGALLSGFAATR
jgi:AcrR family transcriptional regulator